MADLVGTRMYSCFKCQNSLARQDDIISKGFQVNPITHMIDFSNNNDYTVGLVSAFSLESVFYLFRKTNA